MTDDTVLGGLDPGTWDTLAADHFYSSSTWLRHCADYPGAAVGAVHAATAAGLAAVPTVEFDGTQPLNYHWHKILAGRGLPALPAAGLLVGPRLAYQSHVLRDSDDPALLGELVARVRQAHDRLELREKACVAMYLGTEDVRLLRSAGVAAQPVLLEPDAWIEVPPGGWDAWLTTLTSKRRVTVRREVRAFQEAGCRITHVGLPDCWEQLPALANSMAVKYGYPTRTPEFRVEFERYARMTGPAGRVALCHAPDGTLIGFCLYYVWGDAVYLRWASFDYDRLVGCEEYFNLVYYSQIRLAGELGVRWVHAGKKALEAKVLRGAELRPLWMLDLSPGSPLGPASDLVRRHNARLLAELEADPVTRRAVKNRAEWDLFT
ncbi:hypothetical protein QR97_37425 [Streptomyces sp. PBH53]|uniref:GNAT family N-acetyltransferase n=1 Tax=Streptomyces sp. PBH53 TaxID=1577075 RepID=UPI000654CBDC|nr:GNAT family N-acetyltransferase [Streptomyces sp. PBH53]AKN74645.1 hypothetical protein QR97_37425 [Streptomyces sp. PBH53]